MARRLLACCIAPLALSLLHPEASAAQQPPRIELPPPDATAEVEFTSVQSVRELSDGSLLVADRRERRLVHVDWRGAEAVVGREGPGPGEYRGIGWLHPLAGDTTLFTDSFDGRWHLVVGTRIVETLGQSRPTVAALGPRLSGTDRTGHVLAVQRAGRSGAASAGDTLPLLKARLGSLRVDTVTRLHAPRAGLHRLPATGGRPPAVISGNPFRPVDLALLFPDGWLAVARMRPYRVEWQRPDGGWIRGEALAGSGANALYVVAVDPLGLQTLRRHAWPQDP